MRIDGNLQPSLGDVLLQSLMVEETTLGLFRCEANFLNWGPKDNEVGFLFFDRQVLDFGKTFAVEFGPPGESGPVFAGRITGIEAPVSAPHGRPRSWCWPKIGFRICAWNGARARSRT